MSKYLIQRFIYLFYHITVVPYNALLYLALIRPVFRIGALLSQTEIKCVKKKLKKNNNNTVSLTYGSLQVLPWNNDSIIEKMAGWKWCHHITDFFQYMHAWNQGCIKIIIYNISLLQFLFCKNTANFEKCMDAMLLYNKKGAYHRMDGCNWNCELALKKGMTASACFKETQYTISLQVASRNNDSTTQMYGCKCSFEIATHLK